MNNNTMWFEFWSYEKLVHGTPSRKCSKNGQQFLALRRQLKLNIQYIMACKYAIKTANAYNNTWTEILHQEVRMAVF